MPLRGKTVRWSLSLISSKNCTLVYIDQMHIRYYPKIAICQNIVVPQLEGANSATDSTSSNVDL